MPNGGKFIKLEMASVRNGAKKSSDFVRNSLVNRTTNYECVVVFLGETHRNEIDKTVATELLASPPIAGDVTQTRLILERDLDSVYVNISPQFGSTRVERGTLELTNRKRSSYLADRIRSAFDEEGVRTVYVACGSAHAEEVFNDLNKACQAPFTFFFKPSCTEL